MCKPSGEKPFLSRVVNFFRFPLKRSLIFTLYLSTVLDMNFTNFAVSLVIFFFLGTVSKIELFGRPNRILYVSVWQIEATKCEHARFTYIHIGSVEFNSVELL